MTTPSCNKTAFKTYFHYRLRSRLKLTVVTFLLNFWSIVLFSLNYSGSNDNDILIGLAVCAAVVQFALTIIGGTKAFDYCLNKESTDTFFSLPITRGEMFKADFLSGYISHVCTLLPCSFFSMIFACTIYQFGDNYIGEFAELNLTLFLSYTFAYVLSALITICCGRKGSAVKYTLVSALLILAIVPTIGNYIRLCLIDDVSHTPLGDLAFAPPIGTFFIQSSILSEAIIKRTSLFSPYNLILYLFYIPIIAALIALAYFAFKFRKPENTGNNIAVKSFNYVFSGAVTFTLTCSVCRITYSLHMWWLSALISAVVGGIIMLILTLAEKPKQSERKKHFIKCGSIVVGCIALLFIFDKTGAFGARYYNISAENTIGIDIEINEQVSYFGGHQTIYENLSIHDKEDIKQFIGAYNKTLRDHSDELQGGNEVTIVFYHTDGRIVKRSYSGALISFDNVTGNPENVTEGIEEMINNVRSLPHYPETSGREAALMIEMSNKITARLSGKFGEVDIGQNKAIKEILSRDISEHFDINAEPVGMITCEFYNRYDNIPIQSGYVDTINYIESLRTDDGEKEAFSISYYGDPVIEMKLKLKHLEQSAVKELLSLLKVRGKDDNHSGNEFAISSTDGSSYYVPDENKERVIDLMLTIIETNSSEFLSLQPQQ